MMAEQDVYAYNLSVPPAYVRCIAFQDFTLQYYDTAYDAMHCAIFTLMYTRISLNETPSVKIL